MKFCLAFSLYLITHLSWAAELRINEIQFVGSHNSYKKAMLPADFAALLARNPSAARSLEYAHQPLTAQLDLGIRKLELDIFNQPGVDDFVVGHVQEIDMQSHCGRLTECLKEVLAWSAENASHVPIWISFNAKDGKIPGLQDPHPYNSDAFARLDQLLISMFGTKLISPREVASSSGPLWPTLAQARGKFLLVLDEGGQKRATYAQGWRDRPMFVNVAPPHPAAAVMVINDPIRDFALIQQRVREGYMVRTRADADTAEARNDSTDRRDRAFASGAQAISTDYYSAGNPFGTDYWVEPIIGCNPVLVERCLLEQ